MSAAKRGNSRLGTKKTATKKTAAKKTTAKKTTAKKTTAPNPPSNRGIKVATRGARTGAAAAGVRITKSDALVRTIIMLSVEWNVHRDRIGPDSKLLSPPLNGNANALGALEVPIETRYFVDVECEVTQTALRALATATKTVADLRDFIWKGVPSHHRNP